MAQLRVNATKIKQKSHTLYVFAMNSAELMPLTYVTPRSQDDPKEIQRILNKSRTRDIGRYIQQELSIFPNAIVLSLDDEVEIQNTGEENVVTIIFPSRDGKHAYILDGQHRLSGFGYSDGVQFDLPVVALQNADEALRAKIFADINSKQMQVSDVHLLELYYQIKALPHEESATVDVVQSLAKDADSPLKNRVKLFDDQNDTWVKNTALKRWLGPHTQSGGLLSGKNPSEQARIFKEYFKGVEKTWPSAWGDKGHALTKPFGIEIMCAAFRAAKYRVDLNAGRQYTASNFAQQIEVLRDMEITIPGTGDGGGIPLTWESGPLGPLSNAAGRTLISRQIIDTLQSADDELH
jgi:DGQHR domain-containing protein